MSPADLRRLQRRLRPRSRASRNVRRILRRMRHHGGGTPPRDEKGNRRPATFLGMIGRVLELRAHRRKPGRRTLPRSLRAMAIRCRRERNENGDHYFRAITRKRARLRFLSSALREGKITLPSAAFVDDYAEQLATFPDQRHDDTVDALTFTLTRPR